MNVLILIMSLSLSYEETSQCVVLVEHMPPLSFIRGSRSLSTVKLDSDYSWAVMINFFLCSLSSS